MGFEIVVKPSGSLNLKVVSGDEAGAGENKERKGRSAGWESKVAEGFALTPAAGLFALCANKSEITGVGAFSFWCEFAKLVGVTPATIYNREKSKKALKLRANSVKALKALI